ncbi:MAG: penicillin-binding transpeptidase domain-containing protein [Cellulosilyticaceae bacterium]
MNKKSFFKSRIFIVLVGVCTLFSVILMQFVKLQLVEQEEHLEEVKYSTQRRLETEGLRGEVFDRYGRPLAINKPIYTLKLDQQVRMSKKELNASILEVVKLLEANGDTYIDQIPISTEPPFVFTQGSSARRLFINSIPYNGSEHRDEILTYDAEELMAYLRSKDVFQVDESYTDVEARKIVAIRHQMYQVAYQKYKPITIAEDISMATVSVIFERQANYPNMMAQLEAYRYYPYGTEFGNVLGYTRAITASQYESLKVEGYDKNDVIGQMGIEQSMEDELRGKNGLEVIEVDNVGRKVYTLQAEEAVPGNDVFLTIDANIQLQVYQAIEARLAEAIIQRMVGGMRGVEPLKAREILVSMVESNQLSLKVMEAAEEGTMQHEVYQKLRKWYDDYLALPREEYEEELGLKGFLVGVLHEEEIRITDRELLLMLQEQGSLKLEEKLVERIWKGQYPALKDIMIEELRSGDLKPSQMAIEPFSASAVVVEPNTGNVLALVGYPSYDSNEMTSNFNAYYSMLQDGIDQRNLLWNRALMTAKAPGSTFKMISSIAGLETGVVTTSTMISDSGPYTKVGSPYPRCWFFTNNGYGHGPANVHRALEVSCNYYFYELAYRLGLKYGMPFGAINMFTKYAEMFGLGEKTGIELPETAPNISNPENLLKTNIIKSLNVIRNATSKGQEVFDELIYAALESGGYEASKNLFEEISVAVIQDMKIKLQNEAVPMSELLAKHILEDTSSRSMKAKTKETVARYLENLISPATFKMIEEAEDTDDAKELQKNMVKNIVDYLFESVNLEWTNAINVRTAIGQGNNAFTPVHLSRYMAALANGETLYDLKLVNGIMDNKEESGYEQRPDKVHSAIDVKQSTLDAVYEGMYRVINGREGTARSSFADSKVVIAGKTGTAQETGTEHSWFSGFAPFDNPEIAVVTSMYDAKGLGKYNYTLANDIFNAILAPEKQQVPATMGNLFVE